MNAKISARIRNKTILITGGTGSFGQSVVELLLALHPKRIIIFSRDEKKQHDMRNLFNNQTLKFMIGDVRDLARVYEVTKEVDYIFHAAALKQVPTCEFFPMEAIKTNVIGTYNVISAAVKHNVKKVVVLSTDKAVYPINVIGMTKALMEKIMIADSKRAKEFGRNKTILCGVRYGNVLYTRGSVVPYFVDQVKENKKITVTSLQMTRFLLPLREAVDLVLYALTEGEEGYMYVRKSPSATLETIAKAICEVFGHKKGFYEVGIRAGEKMHETLVAQEELIRAKETKEYYKIPPESQGLDYNKYFYQGEKTDVEKIVPFTSANSTRLNTKETVDLLLSLPEVKKELKNFKQTQI